MNIQLLSTDYFDFFIYKLKYFKTIVKNRFNTKTILFYPEIPNIHYVIYKICHLLGYRITNKISDNFDFAITWQDTTFRNNDNQLQQLSEKHKVINYRCLDISKVKVDEVFKCVFGYSASINPLIFRGKCVKKSNINAKHDGEIITCPIERIEPAFVYQRLLNNQVDQSLIVDIRVPIFLQTIPFLYLKYRKAERRFSNINYQVTLTSVDKILSMEEVNRILLFCKQLGLDYGELDIIKNSDDGKVYIIDAANTPYGPPNHISQTAEVIALNSLSLAFDNLIMKISQ